MTDSRPAAAWGFGAGEQEGVGERDLKGAFGGDGYVHFWVVVSLCIYMSKVMKLCISNKYSLLLCQLYVRSCF